MTYFDEVPSTQDIAIAEAMAGAPGRLLVLAGSQSAGRGRDGRLWRSPAGNLYASLLLRPMPEAPLGACWSALAGVALFDAVAPHATGRLVLKAPNDLLLDGSKLAGLLVDTAMAAAGFLDWVVIGAGVNLATAPDLPDRPTASLGAAIGARPLALAFAAALDAWLAAGWDAVWAAYNARLA